MTEYEQAFERAKSAYGTGAYDDATMEFLFPRLKESDKDKKMLDHLLAILEEYGLKRFVRTDDYMFGLYVEEVYEWVKDKFKTAKSASDEEKDALDDIIRDLKRGVAECPFSSVGGCATISMSGLIARLEAIKNKG